MTNYRHLGWLTAALLLSAIRIDAGDRTKAPPPIAPVPASNQVEWQQRETIAFIHFGMNTFHNLEWGDGSAPASDFRPSAIDCEQWARVLSEAGMKEVILTCKHHDGFCLWPSQFTDYTIAHSPYKNGRGDVVKELSEACRKYGLKFGVYLSPWDRHQAFYGSPAYVDYYYSQLHELLTRYGDIYEVWLDGANGGDGYYGGAREKRTIDRRTYYHFDRARQMVSALQPHAVIFSDAGPGCRWVGNERGYADATNWSFLRSKDVYVGYDKAEELTTGHPDGDAWVPAECDVSIRPGWFYHASEDSLVKSPDELMEIYYRSVGRNGLMLLNVPAGPDGRIHDADIRSLMGFRARLKAELGHNLLRGASVKASDVRGDQFAAARTVDGQYDSYWAPRDGVTRATLTLTLPQATAINRLMLQEFIPLGQRVRRFHVDYQLNGRWVPVNPGEATTTVGYKRLLRFPTIRTRRLRITIDDARACPCINEIGAFMASDKL